jgi:hemerythrin
MPDTSPRYVLGLPEMDEQHSYLYSLFDRIEQAPHVGNRTAAAALLDEIERYLMFHFESEELLMRRYGFPGFAQHQSDHETAGSRLVQFNYDFERGALNPAALKIFLTGWLMEHSEKADSEYVAWIRKCREQLDRALTT